MHSTIIIILLTFVGIPLVVLHGNEVRRRAKRNREIEISSKQRGENRGR